MKDKIKDVLGIETCFPKDNGLCNNWNWIVVA